MGPATIRNAEPDPTRGIPGQDRPVFGQRRVRFVPSPPGHELLTALAAYVERKAVTPTIDSVYPVQDIASAHRSVEAGGGFGKRVIRLA
jgi:NADPH:quinone reductase-like Zn-dependent oxidoreductase